MVEKDVILKEKIKYAGLADFGEAYSFAHRWLKEEDYDITEDIYQEKIKGEKKDLKIRWTASRILTDYFTITLEVQWRIFGMSEVEVEIDGKRKKMNKFVELGLEIKGILVKDWSNKWEPKPGHKVLKGIYHKYVIPSRVLAKEEEVKKTVREFKEEMKAFFELSSKRIDTSSQGSP